MPLINCAFTDPSGNTPPQVELTFIADRTQGQVLMSTKVTCLSQQSLSLEPCKYRVYLSSSAVEVYIGTIMVSGTSELKLTDLLSEDNSISIQV